MCVSIFWTLLSELRFFFHKLSSAFQVYTLNFNCPHIDIPWTLERVKIKLLSSMWTKHIFSNHFLSLDFCLSIYLVIKKIVIFLIYVDTQLLFFSSINTLYRNEKKNLIHFHVIWWTSPSKRLKRKSVKTNRGFSSFKNLIKYWIV